MQLMKIRFGARSDEMNNLNTFQLEQAFGFHVNRVSYLMTEEIEKRFAQAGLPIVAQDFAILFRLFSSGTLSQADIVHLMMRDKTTVTRRLDGLVKKGLIARSPNAEDRRRFDIHLTKEGKAILDTAFPLARDFQKELVQDIPQQDKEITIQVLKKVMGSLMDLRQSK